MIPNQDQSSHLTEAETKAMEEVVERAPDRDLTYSQVFDIVAVPNMWAESGEYYKADADDTESHGFGRPGDNAPRMKVAAAQQTYNVLTTHHGFVIPMGDIANSRAFGRPLSTEYAERATRQVQEDLNMLAWVGIASFGITSIAEASGVTTITGTDWDTANLDLANEVITYMHSVPPQYRMLAYSLALADKEYKKLTKYFNSSAGVGDRSHMERIRAALPNLMITPPEINLDAGTALGGGGTLATGVGFLIPKVRSLVKMPLAMSPNLTLGNLPLNKGVEGEVMARAAAPVLVQAESVGKITGLDS